MRRGTLNKVPASSWGHRWLRRWWLEFRSNLDCQDFAKKTSFGMWVTNATTKMNECNKNIDSCLDRPGQCAFSIHWSHREFCNCSSSSRCFQPCDPDLAFLASQSYQMRENSLEFMWIHSAFFNANPECWNDFLILSGTYSQFCWTCSPRTCRAGQVLLACEFWLAVFIFFRWMISQAIWLLSKPQSLKASLVLFDV